MSLLQSVLQGVFNLFFILFFWNFTHYKTWHYSGVDMNCDSHNCILQLWVQHMASQHPLSVQLLFWLLQLQCWEQDIVEMIQWKQAIETLPSVDLFWSKAQLKVCFQILKLNSISKIKMIFYSLKFKPNWGAGSDKVDRPQHWSGMILKASRDTF